MIMMMIASVTYPTILILVSVVSLHIVCVNSQLPSTNGTWVQIGKDINGDSAYTHLGESVAISGDGTTVAIGIPDTEGVEGYATGTVRVYKSNSTSIPARRRSWTQLGADIIGNGVSTSFGNSLAASADGNRMVVGVAPQLSNNSYARVIQYNVTSRHWDQLGSGTFEVSPSGHHGSDVAMSADGMVIAITAPKLITTLNDGTVSVYGLNITTLKWEQRGATIDTRNYHYFARTTVAMSADGNIIVVGAPTVGKAPGQDFGQVIVYKYLSLTKRWRQVGPAINGFAKGGVSCDDDKYFGSDVTISADGTTVAIASTTGRWLYVTVRVFQYSMMNKTWVKIGNDIEDVDVDIGLKGYSISMTADGRTIAIGCGGASYTGKRAWYYLHAGRTRVFTYDANGTDDWEQVGSDILGEATGDRSGTSVALSLDGSILAIGAPNNYGDIPYMDSKGHVRVFEFQPSNLVVVAANNSIHCTYSWNLYNSIADTLVAPLTNGIVISNPPPCNRTNIEAVIQCNNNPLISNNTTTVVLELYNANGTQLIHRRNERAGKYFLYGNNGVNNTNVLNGRIPAGTYMIRASVMNRAATVTMTTSNFTKFTLGGTCV